MRIVLGIVAATWLAGCGAVGLPRPLTPEEFAELDGTPVPLVLAIDGGQYGDIAEPLIRVLRERGVFAEVGHVEDLGERADLVGRIEYEHQPLGAVIPLYSIVSLGVVPSVYHETQVATLRFDGLARRTRINSEVRVPVVMGWVALLLRLSRRWSPPMDPRDMVGNSERLAEHLAVAVARRAREIERLAERPVRYNRRP